MKMFIHVLYKSGNCTLLILKAHLIHSLLYYIPNQPPI